MKRFFNVIKKSCLQFIIAGAILPQSKNIFVSPQGNDSNSGLTVNSPRKTISTSLDLTVPGDTLFLLKGKYSEVIRVIGKSGTEEKPICIFGYSSLPGERPLIDGGADAPALNLSKKWIEIQNSNWIEIKNLEFRNGWTDPVQIINSAYLTFDGCYLYGGRKAIAASGDKTHHLLIQNCFWDQGGDYLWKFLDPAGIEPSWTMMHDGSMIYYNGSFVNFSGTGGSIVIRNNVIQNAFNGIRCNGQAGYDSNVEIYGNSISNIRDNDIEPESYAFNLFIHHNRSHNIHKTMSVDNVGGGYIYYFGNRITSNMDSWSNQICTGFWKVHGTSKVLAYPMVAFNNSFCGVGKAFGSMNGKAVQFKHFNNAYFFTGSRTWELTQWDGTNEFDYDISNKQWASNIIQNNNEKNGKIADVRYFDTSKFDLRLQSASPAYDAGKIISLPELNWTSVYEGAAPDIGAYENNSPVEGPAFKFINSSELKISFKDKPRIVRAKIAGNKLDLHFSSPIDFSTVSIESIILSQNGAKVFIASVTSDDNGYILKIETAEALDENKLKLNFDPAPVGKNGETVTLWGAALDANKRQIVTSVKEISILEKIDEKPSFKIYPNPFNSITRFIIKFPESVSDSKEVNIKVFDIVGRLISSSDHRLQNGKAEIMFDGFDLSSGIYFVSVNSLHQKMTQKIIVLK